MLFFFYMDEDKIINAILHLSDGIEDIQKEMLTKTEGRSIQDVLESHTTILKNIQEDHLFSIEWLKRLQELIDKQAEGIHFLKRQLHIV